MRPDRRHTQSISRITWQEPLLSSAIVLRLRLAVETFDRVL